MNDIEIYTWPWCPYCIAAKRLLKKKKLSFTEYEATDPTIMGVMQQRSGRTSVPQIFINGNHVGGYDDLSAMEMSGQLESLLVSA